VSDSIVGLIAGMGSFPLAIARAARRSGSRVHCLAIRDLADPAIEQEVEGITWIHLGEAAKGVAAFTEAGVKQAVMAGKVPKDLLFRGDAKDKFDSTGASVMGELADRKDDTILGAVAKFMETLGIEVLPQWALAPELLAGAEPLGSVVPTEEQEADIAFGFPLAKRYGQLDIGQTIVVKDRAVLAVEAIEGTDATIRRAGEIAAGACVLKVEKQGQDPRFDVPTIGLETIRSLVAARASVLAFEAGVTVVLDREALAREADSHGIAVVGVDPERLEQEIQ
jgi:DUF1009 family protein